MSYIAINRVAEEQAAADPAYRRKLEKKGKKSLSHGRAMSDEQLLAKLRSLGIELDRDQFLHAAEPFCSAEAMSEPYAESMGHQIADSDIDWIWIALCCLWERWNPDRPSFEMIDDWIQQGYKIVDEEVVAGCELWLKAWRAILKIMEKQHIATTDEFDELFNGTESVFNWLQDFEGYLYRAALEQPEFNRERIAICRRVLVEIEGKDGHSDLRVGNFRNALAESYVDLGEMETAEQLRRKWLAEDPQWGLGWVGWADQYCHGKDEHRDLQRAEQILKQGLAVPGVRERSYLMEHLSTLYEQSGRIAEAAVARAESMKLQRQEIVEDQLTRHLLKDFLAIDEPADLDPHRDLARDLPLIDRLPGTEPIRHADVRVGRNDPCSCGSGKKFKKCCLNK